MIKLITKETKIIFVCGPSSSTKTTFSNKLVHMIKKAKRVSMDDFFEDPKADSVPKINGNPDFEHLYALRVEFLKETLVKIINNEEVSMPGYDFHI